MGLSKELKAGMSTVFRKAFIKRMNADGSYESDWFEITKDVIKFGSIGISIDASRFNKINFGSNSIVLSNIDGKYNPEDNPSSVWFNYATQQRSLFKIEAGYLTSSLGSDGIYKKSEIDNSVWDRSYWDEANDWDATVVLYKGVISGDVNYSDKTNVNFNVMPLMEIFRQFPADDLTGFTSTGLTASQLMENIRDHTDGAANYVFRPFFENTTSNWEIEATTSIYADLNTNSSAALVDLSLWDLIEKISQAENYLGYVNSQGVFRFVSRAANTTTSQFEFNGPGITTDNTYGVQIKSIKKFGPKYSKFYSRVSLKYKEADTISSYQVLQASLTVDGGNLAWILGRRSISLENTFVATSTVASTLVTNIFNDVSSLKKEIEFNTPFVPGLDILDLCKISYDTSAVEPENLWDLNNWGDATAVIATGDLIWDLQTGDAIKLDSEEYNLINININLDTLENNFIAREN